MMDAIGPEELYFAKDAAKYLGITTQRLNTLVKEGKIRPFKKSSSGTLFHINELKKRKDEMLIFSESRKEETKGEFIFDTKNKREALNFATLMNVLQVTEQKLDPLFSKLAESIDVTMPMDDESVINEYIDYFDVNKSLLIEEYKKAWKAFSRLLPTDMIVKRGDQDYPELLSDTKQAPRFLYLRGRMELLKEKRTVALVGSRQASYEGKRNAESLARVLGRNGITIISGLAKGIDVSAHKAALESGFNTIAVIGTNLNQYYPAENKSVQKEIEKKGLIVSQFSPANITQNWFFPLRNGVMSGLSLATVIIEAGETSGALKQADYALKQNREVLIPQSALRIDGITWPHRYLDRGARLVKQPSDVIRILSENKIYKTDINEQQSFDSLFETVKKEEALLAWIDIFDNEDNYV